MLLLVWLSCVIIILQGSIAQSIFVMAWPRLRVYWQWELPLSNPLNLLCFFFINILTNKSLSNFPPSFFSIYTLTFSKGLLTQPLADKGAGGTPGPLTQKTLQPEANAFRLLQTVLLIMKTFRNLFPCHPRIYEDDKRDSTLYIQNLPSGQTKNSYGHHIKITPLNVYC